MATPLTETRVPRQRSRLRLVREQEPGTETRGPRLGNLFGFSILALGALVLAFIGFLLGGSRLQANHSQSVLYDKVATSLSNATVPVSGLIKPGTAIGIIKIPELGVDQVLVQGAASQQTAVGPGLRSDSVLPGQAGLSVVLGRRSTYGAPFRNLDRLRVGAPILVITGQGRFHYVVDVVRRSSAPPTTIPDVASRLTLITSDPAFTPDQQLIVSAALDGKAQPVSTVRVTRPDEAAGHGNGGQAVPLLLWSQALLGIAVLITWAAMKFPKRAVWIGAAPVLIAVLWNVFDNLAIFLPNTL